MWESPSIQLGIHRKTGKMLKDLFHWGDTVHFLMEKFAYGCRAMCNLSSNLNWLSKARKDGQFNTSERCVQADRQGNQRQCRNNREGKQNFSEKQPALKRPYSRGTEERQKERACECHLHFADVEKPQVLMRLSEDTL